MGIVIKATGISTDPSVRSSIAHASAAARACIEQAGVRVEEIDLMMNVGIYRDSNMMEPAMSALIQKEIGLNRDYVKFPCPKPAFSFDLMNGACGAMNAVQVAKASLLLDEAQYVLVVSSDAHPSNANVLGFPYATVGGAMLLEKSGRDEQGFGRLQARASDDANVGFEGYIDSDTMGCNGRSHMTISEQPRYKERLLELVAASVREYAVAESLDLQRTLLVTTQVSPDFGAQLARQLGAPEAAAVRLSGIDGDPHSSALTIGYHTAIAQGMQKGYDQALFVAAGAGITSACAVYRW